MTHFLVELSDTWLGWICLAAWRTLPLFAVVAAITCILKQRLPARFHCLLWMLVIVRLCLPVSIDAPYSLSGAVERVVERCLPEPEDEIQYQTFTFSDGQATVTLPLLPPDTALPPGSVQEASDGYLLPDQTVGESIMQPDPKMVVQMGIQPSWWEENFDSVLIGLSRVWLIGVLAILLRGLIHHVRFARHIRRQSNVEDSWVIDLILRSCDAIGVGRRPRIKEVAGLHSPAVFGFWRPVLCLPSDWRQQLSREQLDWVFKHELAHIRRRDALTLGLAGIARAVHWFHPLPWVTLKNLHARMEQAADEAATMGLGQSQVRDYGALLLKYASQRPTTVQPAVVGLLAMASTDDLRGRIDALHACSRRNSRWFRSLCLPMILLIALSGLTDANKTEIEPESKTSQPWVELGDEHPAFRNPHPGFGISDEHVFEHQFDVRQAIAKAKQLQTDVDAESFVIHYFGAFDAQKTRIEDGILHTVTTPRKARLTQELLDAFCDSGLWQVAMEFRVIQSDTRLFRQVDWLASGEAIQCKRIDGPLEIGDSTAWDDAFQQPLDTETSDSSSFGNPNKFTLPLRATKVEDQELGQIVRSCSQNEQANMVMAPKVTLFNGQTAAVRDVVQRPFVTDVVPGKGERKGTLQPKISIFEDGWTIQVQPIVRSDDRVDIRCVFTESQIGDTELANLPFISDENPGGEVTVQVPSVQSHSIAAWGTLEEGEALLVYSPQPYRNAETAPDQRARGMVYSIRPVLLNDHEILEAFVPPPAEMDVQSESASPDAPQSPVNSAKP